jgi:hypothetical protein
MADDSLKFGGIFNFRITAARERMPPFLHNSWTKKHTSVIEIKNETQQHGFASP